MSKKKATYPQNFLDNCSNEYKGDVIDSQNASVEDNFNSQIASVEDGYKLFHDSVHGPIKLDSLLVAIIDTPQYQRLRDIKQLGAIYWVYPGASHNRFSHGIGTSYLCGVMISTLRELHNHHSHDYVEITDKEILCIKVAGLCHDMGHGPFSHLFDDGFLKRAEPIMRHEEMSCRMFDYMLNVNPYVKELFTKKGLGDNEIMFIKRLILGCDPRKDKIYESCIYRNLRYTKWFLYEIVANKRTGIDCDKFDYFARDTLHIGLNNAFNHTRFFQNIRILPINDQLQVCIRDKEVMNVYELFHVRWLLHRQVYQHKNGSAVDEMIFQALKKVDKKYDISLSLQDMSKYTSLTDSIIYDVLRSKDTSLNVVEAKAIITKLQRRQLYRFCGEVNAKLAKQSRNAMTPSPGLDESTIAEEICEYNTELEKDDIFVRVVYISYGKQKDNPVDEVNFFSKNGFPFTIKTEKLSDILPKNFEEHYIRVYCKELSKEKYIKKAFHQWCLDKNYFITTPNPLDES